MHRALVIAALALAAAGCGGDDEADGDTAAADSTRLTIHVHPEGEEQSFARYDLRCDPAGGTFPEPEAACERLAATDADAFAPVPADTACTQQYGGPQVATVEGVLRGEPVDARFTRTDGCQIARWDKLAFLFPEDDGT